jgi:hypothetical protein
MAHLGWNGLELKRARHFEHGHKLNHSESPTHRSYRAAKARCTNPNNNRYYRYGGRGIKFRFKSFTEFLAELGIRPEGMSLDRINPDGHYEPGNVRWANVLQQRWNRSK